MGHGLHGYPEDRKTSYGPYFPAGDDGDRLRPCHGKGKGKSSS
jgi:hypothetical protein